MKWIDMPPVWLVGFVFLARVLGQASGVVYTHPVFQLAGGLLVGGGLVLMAVAIAEFRRHKTTVIPHKTPTALLTTGIYARSRNPIYLADVMILTGLICYWGLWLSLALVPLFMWILLDRFIAPEEVRLSAHFGRHFEAWRLTTRRWI